MTYICKSCKRTFTNELRYELHRDTCSANAMICERCGDQFSERRATRDGWHYSCPNEDCEGRELGSDLHAVDDFSVVTH